MYRLLRVDGADRRGSTCQRPAGSGSRKEDHPASHADTRLGPTTAQGHGLGRLDKPLRRTCRSGVSDRTRPEHDLSGEGARTGPHYLITSYTLNIGMYIATTMKPTMPPTSMIITGSRIDVSALTAAATSSS